MLIFFSKWFQNKQHKEKASLNTKPWIVESQKLKATRNDTFHDFENTSFLQLKAYAIIFWQMWKDLINAFHLEILESGQV